MAYPSDKLAEYAPFTVKSFRGGSLRFAAKDGKVRTCVWHIRGEHTPLPSPAWASARAARSRPTLIPPAPAPLPTQVTIRGEHNAGAVTKAGLDAGRAVVHAVDAVLLPENVFYTILDALDFYGSTSILQARGRGLVTWFD